MRKSLLLAAVLLLSAGVCLAGDPVVSNVRAQQRGGGSKLVDIYYDVADSDGDRLTVAVAITDGGTAIPAASLTGAVGANVSPGSGKQIVWDAGADWPGQLSENVRATVTADDGRTPAVPQGMALIPAGSFSMGDAHDGLSSALPVHSVFVSAFYMDRYEVTKAKWDEVANWAAANGYDITAAGASGKAVNHPAHYVTWYECVKWCNARSQKEGLTPCYTVGGATYKTGSSAPDCNWSASGYRLPTEAEWEKAARGGASGRRFPWSDSDFISHSRANYYAGAGYSYDQSSGGYHPTYNDGTTPYTSPAGAFAANGYGLYDMAGNVWEWCWDWYGSAYYSSSPSSNPRGPSSGSYRVLRGGSWRNYAYYCRVAYRYIDPPGSSSSIGFRLVRTAP